MRAWRRQAKPSLGVFPRFAVQRCQFHLQQNAQSYVLKLSLRTEVAEDIRTIFDTQDRDSAESQLKDAVKKYARIAPKLADWMEVNLPEGFSVFAFPRIHQKRLRTSNTLEGSARKSNVVPGLSASSLMKVLVCVLSRLF